MRSLLFPFAVVLTLAACHEQGGHAPLSGASPLVAHLNAAAAEYDVPAELIAGIAWSETAFLDHSRRWNDHDQEDHKHGPRSAGVMGLPEHGRVRSVARAAELT